MKLKLLFIIVLTMLCIVGIVSPTNAQSNNGFAQNIARDLVGQEIKDPKHLYFPEEWSWTLEREEVLSVEITDTKSSAQVYNADIIAHLKRGNLHVDVRMFVKYRYNGQKWVLTQTYLKALSIPKQTDYSKYVRLYMDYDFFPTLTLKNNCDKNLFVFVEAVSNGEKNYFSTIAGPYEKVSVAIGPVQNHKVIFAYLK